MNYINSVVMKKLKPDYSIVGLMPAILSITILAIVSVSFGIEYGIKTLGGIIMIYAFLFGFWFYVKTRNPNYLISFLYLISLSLVFFFMDVDRFDRRQGFPSEAKFFLISVYFFGLWLLYLLIRKKLKWKGREIMELVAKEVDEGQDSYTERPKPVDRIELNKHELIEFMQFLKRNLIFYSFENGEGIILVPIKHGKEFAFLFSNPDLEENTWVKIKYDGQVTVKISQKDYLDYKYDLSYDQLTEQMGSLVAEFATSFKKGESVRILDKIDQVKVGHFS